MEEQKPEQEMHSGPTEKIEKPPVKPEPPVSGPLAQFEAWLYDVLVVKAPYQLPKAAKDWIVQYGPWITVAVGVLMVLAIIPTLLIALSISSYTMYGMYYATGVASFGATYYLALLILAAQLAVMFVSVPLLIRRLRKGWLLVFYSSIVSLLYTVVNAFSFNGFAFGSLLMGFVGAALSMYFIFQIRSYYKI